MPKPLSALAARRQPEQVLAEYLRGLADEATQIGYPEHGLIIRLAAADFERLATLNREMREGGVVTPEGRAWLARARGKAH